MPFRTSHRSINKWKLRMSIFGTSEVVDKYVEALIREGDEFDYSKWLRENRCPQAEPKPTGVRSESPPSTSPPFLDDGTPTPAIGAVGNLRTEPKDLSAATGDAPVCADP